MPPTPTPRDCVLKWPEAWEGVGLVPEPSSLLTEPHVCLKTGCTAPCLEEAENYQHALPCHLSLGPGTLACEAVEGVLEEGRRKKKLCLERLPTNSSNIPQAGHSCYHFIRKEKQQREKFTLFTNSHWI